jgi:hypothetical protein
VTGACWNCDAPADLDNEVFCSRCHADLMRAPAPAAVPTSTAVPVAPAGTAATWTCSTPGCNGQPVAAGQTCPFCGASAAAEGRLVLASPTFEVALCGGGPWTLGRESADSPQLSGMATVSRRHASIARRAGRYEVADLASTNGTYVDGEQLRRDEARVLEAGAVVRLGRSVELSVRSAS